VKQKEREKIQMAYVDEVAEKMSHNAKYAAQLDPHLCVRLQATTFLVQHLLSGQQNWKHICAIPLNFTTQTLKYEP
jgi:hypothetical protein